MTPTDRQRIVDRLGAEGLDVLVRNAAVRAAVRRDAELRALVQALAELDDRLAALDAPRAPDALVDRAIAAARDVAPDARVDHVGVLVTPSKQIARTPRERLRAAADAIFAFADRLPLGVRVVGGSLAVGALALVFAVPALWLTQASLSGDDASNADAAAPLEERMTAVMYEVSESDDRGEVDGRSAAGPRPTSARGEPPEPSAPEEGWLDEVEEAEAPARWDRDGDMNGLGGLGTRGVGTGGGGAPGYGDGLAALGGEGEDAPRRPDRAIGGDFAQNALEPPATVTATTRRAPAASPSPPPPPADPAPDDVFQNGRGRGGRGMQGNEPSLHDGLVAMDVERSADRAMAYRGQRADAADRDGQAVVEDDEVREREVSRQEIEQRSVLALALDDEEALYEQPTNAPVQVPAVTDTRNADQTVQGQLAQGQTCEAQAFGEAGGEGRWQNERDPAFDTVIAREVVSESTIVPGLPPARAASPAVAAARAWLARRERIDGVETRPATGYWRNTYVPGDPLVRGLQQQVREAGGEAADLLDGARRAVQPYDPPTNAAMAVYVHADEAAIDGPRRMLVEVGLQGTARQTGRRPAMNVGVVLDLRGADASDGDAVCALMESLADARDIGDRFSVVVAGRAGDLLVPADDFGWGAVRVACDRLFGDDADLGRGGLDLAAAWDRAFDTVLATDDPTAALGSSFVWVVSPGLSSMDASLLASRAHTAAVDGVPTSVVGLNGGGDTALLDRVALAGQGHRRLVGSAEDAAAVVDAEITAISRVVARAVRLRIRLAPGVQLVDVIGSERLDEARAEQVRQAEQAIDQRLSRNLGIQADRGEDEDGIQIVIPAFMADDHHVILLDVIADGPGAVVDVTARYKDLVHLRNGVSRGHLSVPRGDVEPGPLALNVTRNLVAWDVAQALTRAAAQMDAGARDAATDELRRAASLVRGLRATVPGFASDASLDADLDLLADAVATTGRAPHGDPGVARALRAAGWLKLFTAPETGDDR